MRIQMRAGVVAGVAVALVLTLPSLSAASPSLAEDGSVDGQTHAQARRILDDVVAALAPRPASSVREPATARRTALPRTDLTLRLRDLRLAREALSPSERATADTYLARPAASCGLFGGSTTLQSPHFELHYCTIGSSASTEEYAATTLATLEEVWSGEVGALGFRAPPADNDGLFDVHLEQLADQGLYGYCAPDTNATHSTSYCVLDNDYAAAEYGAPPLDSLRVTAAHEFFHAIQFGYDTTEDLWLMEGSAVWAEEQVYPAVDDYVQYLGYSAITQPRTPVDYKGVTSSDLFFRYGAVLFWKFLSEQFRDPAVVRRVWEYADGSRFSLQAVDAALAERGWTFRRAFAQFGVWNTLPSGSYGDRALFPQPAWWQSDILRRRHRDTGARAVVLDHLTNAALVLRPARRLPKKTRLRIRVDGPALTSMPAASVQVRGRDGSVRVLGVPLDAAGDGTLRVGFNPRRVDAVVVTLTNASIRMASCGTDRADRFACGGQSADDGRAFAVRARLRLP